MLLEMQNIDKEFPGVKALSSVSISIEKGEVHSLMGENGAGKSTLIKILSGIYPANGGKIIFDGVEIAPRSSFEAQEFGISTIFQELNLIGSLSIAENIYFGRQPLKKGAIDWKKMERDAAEKMQEIGINVNVRESIDSQSIAIQQMVAIIRAITMNAKLVIMDEPTSSLDEDEVKVLFNIINKLKSNGVSVIFISHRLDEIFTVCDKITVLQNGRNVGGDDIANVTKHELVSKMLGRDAEGILTKRKDSKDVYTRDKALCRIENVSDGSKLKNINLEIKYGEIVGLAGLLGSGRTEIAQLLFGCNHPVSGSIFFDGCEVKFAAPADAIKSGVGFCSENRRDEGIFPNTSVCDNMTITVLDKFVKNSFVNRGKQRSMVDKYIDLMSIKTPTQAQQIKNLSGGNQQKVLLSRWMCNNPKLLILDEPTRGIDVGVKAEIMQLILKLASEGIGVLIISSELEELVVICDKIAVIRDGQKCGELYGDDISVEAITQTIAAATVK